MRGRGSVRRSAGRLVVGGEDGEGGGRGGEGSDIRNRQSWAGMMMWSEH